MVKSFQPEVHVQGNSTTVLSVLARRTTPRAVEYVADRGPAQAWPLLSIAVLVNFLEACLMPGKDRSWLMVVVVAAKASRYWQPFHDGEGAAGPILRKTATTRLRPLLDRAGGTDRPPTRRWDIST